MPIETDKRPTPNDGNDSILNMDAASSNLEDRPNVPTGATNERNDDVEQLSNMGNMSSAIEEQQNITANASNNVKSRQKIRFLELYIVLTI